MGQFLQLKEIALSKSDGRILKRVKKAAKDVLKANAEEIDKSGTFPIDNLNILKELQITNILAGEEFGGKDASLLAFSHVIDTLAEACPSTTAFLIMHYSVFPILDIVNTKGQFNHILKPIVEGKALCAAATSEIGSGGRVWHLDGYSEEVEGGYYITAKKSFVSGAGKVDFYVVPVKGSEHSSPHDWNIFLIDAKSEGIECVGEWNSLGLRGSTSTPVNFNKVFVPKENLLSSVDNGFSLITAYHLPIFMIGMSSLYLGIAQGAYNCAISHVKSRIHSDTNKSLSTISTIQKNVGVMHSKLITAKAQLHRLCRLAESAKLLFNEFYKAGILNDLVKNNMDDPFYKELLATKSIACQTAKEVTDLAFQICGGSAFKKGHPIERYIRDVKAGSVMAPADDVAQIILGKQILGIKQPWEV